MAAIAQEDAKSIVDAAQAIAAGRAEEAVPVLEALADRGVVGAGVAFDRGLAYATRVKEGHGKPGDLGRAAHAFEEALRRDPNDAAARAALDEVRREIARRDIATGNRATTIDAPPIWRAIVVAAPGDVWVGFAIAGAALLAIALAVRPRVARGARLAASTTAIVALLVTIVASALGLGARWARHHVREAVVVAQGAIATNDEGKMARLAEGTRVDVLEERVSTTKVRTDATEGWVARDALRALPPYRP